MLVGVRWQGGGPANHSPGTGEGPFLVTIAGSNRSIPRQGRPLAGSKRGRFTVVPSPERQERPIDGGDCTLY